MHVQCESCGTEYEFDDALVSGRGTTVKCSTCGFQFKVRRAGANANGASDQWTVTSADGAVFVYGSLRELQRAILTGEVVASDLLERGGVAPRPIGQIAELIPFFDGTRLAPSDRAAPETPNRPRAGDDPPTIRTGSGRPAAAAVSGGPLPAYRLDPDRTAATPARLLEEHLAASRTPLPGPLPTAPGEPLSAQPVSGAGPAPSTLDPMRPRVQTEISFPAPPQRALDDLGGDDDPTRVADSFSVESALAEAAQARAAEVPQVPAPQNQAPPIAYVEAPRAEAHPSAEPTGNVRVTAKLDPALDERLPEVSSPLPPPARQQRWEVEADVDSAVPRGVAPRRSVGGVVVAVVVALAVGGMGAYYVRERGEKPAAALDAKAEAFLAAGEKSLVDGDLERAKENFDKASVLAEKSPRLLLDSARLATARADLSWIRQQILEPGGERDAAKAKTLELAALALPAAEAAVAAAPDDSAAIRLKIDALRAGGQSDKARALVPKVVSQGNQAESAYVLATLDMTTPDPVWSTVLQRLRSAATGEGAAGRARSALVVALVRAGDREGAKGEVTRLETAHARHPLVPPLRAYVERAVSTPSLASVGDAGVVDVSALKALSGGAPTDPRVLVSQAETARGKGKLAVARRLYELALQKNPQDSEALTGLAHVAHAEHDIAGARSAYRRALAVNPSYVPALVGLADLDWESGDRASAQKKYRELVERFPESAYPARVRQRAEGGAPTAPTAPTTEPTSAPSAPSAPSAAPTEAPPAPSAPPSPAPPAPPPAPEDRP